MHASCLILLLTCGQLAQPVVPAPVPESVQQQVQPALTPAVQLQAVMMAELMLNPQYTPEKLAQIKKQFDGMTNEQLLLVYRAYEARKNQKSPALPTVIQAQQPVPDPAWPQPFSDQLNREYQARIMQSDLEQSLFQQTLMNNQAFLNSRIFSAGQGYFGGTLLPQGSNPVPYTPYYGFHAGTPPHYPSWSGNSVGYSYFGW